VLLISLSFAACGRNDNNETRDYLTPAIVPDLVVDTCFDAYYTVEYDPPDITTYSQEPEILPIPEALYEVLRVPVLLYHSVMPEPYYSRYWANNTMVMSESSFRAHMQYLYENNFTIITAAQFEAWYFDDALLPQNPVLLHFDDGYLDNYFFAAPILREFGFTAVNFIPTNLIAFSCHLPEQLGSVLYMSREQMNRSRDVFEFASHSHDLHWAWRNNRRPPILDIDATQFETDFSRSQEEFDMCLPQWYAFPYGAYTQDALAALRTSGVTISWGTDTGYTYRQGCALTLPRFAILAKRNQSGYCITVLDRIMHGNWR